MGLKIGDLSKATGTKVETIRFYEKIGLMPPPERTSGNYRLYTEAHLRRLNFVRHARELGFEIAEIRSLLELSDKPANDCAAVDEIATTHLRAVEAKIARLEALRDELTRMISVCRGGQVASCRVMEALADHSLCQAGHRHGAAA